MNAEKRARRALAGSCEARKDGSIGGGGEHEGRESYRRRDRDASIQDVTTRVDCPGSPDRHRNQQVNNKEYVLVVKDTETQTNKTVVDLDIEVSTDGTVVKLLVDTRAHITIVSQEKLNEFWAF
ncbi:hypothetical protein NDU88_004831 [Pleurodeles waltl]|uniref:Peptidase A2 domain-containing protein n=1 Tax=Pleurodeles waltl TaxID=8319 RepID=A0AAV7WWK0_PLEWA|nr:hypothetical protein NDU88_004831 [Pleurodeles waltl]